MKTRTLFLLPILAAPLLHAQDQEPASPKAAAPAPLAGAPPKPVRDAYQMTQLKDFPRDKDGFLTPEIWDIIAKQGALKPGTNEERCQKERPIMQAYYATFKDWKPPVSPAPAEGKLRNLAEIPTKPRFEITGKVWPAKPGEASVCLWADDKLAAMSLGVDDNCAQDLAAWKEIAKKYGGLNTTWNLITHNIDGVVSKGRAVGTGTWKQWQEVLDEGYHLASHSATHNHDPVPADGWPGPDWEAAESIHQIDSHLPGHTTKLFVYPGSGVHAFGILDAYNPEGKWRQALVKYYAAARGAGAHPLNEANMIDYFNIHATTGVTTIFGGSTDPRTASTDLNNLFAADPHHPFHKYYRGWANTFIHFINEGKDFESNPYNKVLDFYNQHRDQLWTGFTDDIALYGQERDTASLTTDEATDARITLTLMSRMDPTIFDYPLTVKVRLPDAWKGVAATQKLKAVPAEIVRHEGGNFALVKALPDHGQVILTPVKAP